MDETLNAFAVAFRLIVSGDSDLLEIVFLSLRTSLMAVFFACLIGLPLGAAIGVFRFRGRRIVIVLLNSLLGLPPVVVGLLVYLMLSRSGPLGFLSLLYTPSAMVIAQIVLVTPIIAAITRQTVEDLSEEYDQQLRSLGISRLGTIGTLLYEGRYRLTTAVLAGLGRAISEVGAVIIVGGNIAHVTKVMTTAIALETSRGELSLALGLGLILVVISLALNGLAHSIQHLGDRAGA